MKQCSLVLLLAALLCAVALTGVALAAVDPYNINWRVLGGGGGPIQSAGYKLNGTAGQGIVSAAQSAGYQLQSGYWSGTVSAAAVPTPTRTPTLPPGVVPRAWLPVVLKTVYVP